MHRCRHAQRQDAGKAEYLEAGFDAGWLAFKQTCLEEATYRDILAGKAEGFEASGGHSSR
jgi:hypothetical protein